MPKPTRKPQRDLFTFRALRRLLSQIRAGLTPEAAAHSASVSVKILKLALSKGVEDLENPNADANSREARLVLAVRAHEAKCQARWVGLLELCGGSRPYMRARTTKTAVPGPVENGVAQKPVKSTETEIYAVKMDSKAFMYLLERRFPREWGPVATATDMHTAAAVDLLRQGVAEMKRMKAPAALGTGETVAVEASRVGVGVRARVPVSFVEEDGQVANAIVGDRLPGLPYGHGVKTRAVKDEGEE